MGRENGRRFHAHAITHAVGYGYRDRCRARDCEGNGHTVASSLTDAHGNAHAHRTVDVHARTDSNVRPESNTCAYIDTGSPSRLTGTGGSGPGR